VKEISEIDVKTQAARIAHTVGKKKRAQIITEARKNKIVILNAKEVKEPAEEKEEKPEKAEEKPTEKQKKPVEKKEKPKKPRKKTKTEEGAEKQ
jgi:large subunit ribosomal protein L32e